MRGQAGRVADGAIDVLHPAAADADGVVVVVAHPRLVQGGGVRWLEAAQHLQVGQVAQHHVDGLRGQFGKLGAGGGEDAFGGGVRVVLDGGQHRQPLLGHPAAVGAQGRSPCVVVPVKVPSWHPFKHLF